MPDTTSLPKSILITGATGYIGTQLTNYLLENENLNATDLYAIVRPGKTSGFPINYCLWDLRNPLPEREFPQQIDAIIHLSAVRERSEDSTKHLPHHIRISVDAVARLYAWAQKHGVQRIVHMSSASVYEPGTDPKKLLSEHSPLVKPPAHPYALTKRWSDELAAQFRTDINSICILRPTQVYGPDLDSQSSFKKLIHQIRSQEPFSIPAPDGHYVCPIYIQDLLNVIFHLLQTANNRTVVLQGPDFITTREIITSMAEPLGVPAKITMDKTLNPQVLAFSPESMEDLGPHQPTTRWKEGMTKMISSL
jgi:nucleoside-diphosphate-sugar epimerase